VYRSKRNGSNDPADARLIKRIPASFTATTVFVDYNRELPNAHTIYILPMGDSSVIEWRQMYAPFRIELPRDVTAAHNIPGMVSASVALRSRRHRSVAKITNYLSRVDGWLARG
jgi:hypothetical protein